jgi:Ulp1 family protease
MIRRSLLKITIIDIFSKYIVVHVPPSNQHIFSSFDFFYIKLPEFNLQHLRAQCSKKARKI